MNREGLFANGYIMLRCDGQRPFILTKSFLTYKSEIRILCPDKNKLLPCELHKSITVCERLKSN